MEKRLHLKANSQLLACFSHTFCMNPIRSQKNIRNAPHIFHYRYPTSFYFEGKMALGSNGLRGMIKCFCTKKKNQEVKIRLFFKCRGRSRKWSLDYRRLRLFTATIPFSHAHTHAP